MHIPTWWDIQNILSTTGQDDDYYTTPEKETMKHQATQELGMWGVALCLVSALFMSAGLSLQKMVSQRASLDPTYGPAHKQSMYVPFLYLLFYVTFFSSPPSLHFPPLYSLPFLHLLSYLPFLHRTIPFHFLSSPPSLLFPPLCSSQSTYSIVFLHHYCSLSPYGCRA